MVQIRNLEDGDMITVSLQHNGVWDRSEFPHPFITVDRDASNEVIGFSAIGRFVHPALEAYAAWRKTNTSPEALVGRLRAIELVDEGGQRVNEGESITMMGRPCQTLAEDPRKCGCHACVAGRLRVIELVDEKKSPALVSPEEFVSELERRCGGRLRPEDRADWVGVIATIIDGFQARIDQQKPVSIDDALVEEALQTYEDEYRRIYPTGGEEVDHQEAVRSGIAAVVALVQQKAQVPS